LVNSQTQAVVKGPHRVLPAQVVAGLVFLAVIVALLTCRAFVGI